MGRPSSEEDTPVVKASKATASTSSLVAPCMHGSDGAWNVFHKHMAICSMNHALSVAHQHPTFFDTKPLKDNRIFLCVDDLSSRTGQVSH